MHDKNMVTGRASTRYSTWHAKVAVCSMARHGGIRRDWSSHGWTNCLAINACFTVYSCKGHVHPAHHIHSMKDNGVAGPIRNGFCRHCMIDMMGIVFHAPVVIWDRPVIEIILDRSNPSRRIIVLVKLSATGLPPPPNHYTHTRTNTRTHMHTQTHTHTHAHTHTHTRTHTYTYVPDTCAPYAMPIPHTELLGWPTISPAHLRAEMKEEFKARC